MSKRKRRKPKTSSAYI